MLCRNCEASNDNDARFCIDCGTSLVKIQTKEKTFRVRVFNNVPLLNKVHFLQVLFDFSFNGFISSKMMKSLYALSILSAGLIAFLFVLVAFNASMLLGILVLFIGAPLLFLLSVIYSRVLLETILVIFRIADQMTSIGEKLEIRDNIRWNV
ncbi:MAG: DUF4282 domain-containing protein [Thermodesulfobacteriota bacterium]|jgi:ribosomal protein L40E